MSVRNGNTTVWGTPIWAWAAGLLLGAVFGLLLFDSPLVGLIFGFSIGAAFAMAFARARPSGRSTSGRTGTDDAAPNPDGRHRDLP
jgi:hypothetical protein